MNETPVDQDDGIGCRDVTVFLGALVLFSALTATIGLTLALGDDPSNGAQRIGFLLYGAGLPLSAAFSVAGSDLVVAPFTDAVLWVGVAIVGTRAAGRRGHSVFPMLAGIFAIALTYGVFITMSIERA